MNKHFLVIWPTTRKDWVSTFFQLKDDFRFTFIPATFPRKVNFASEFTCRYWSEFESAGEVLDQVQPDGIIFMSIESGISMSINYLANKRGIKAFILQHGVFTNYKDYRLREKLWRKDDRAKTIISSQVTKGFSSFGFLRNSFHGLERLNLLSIALYTKLQQKIGPYWVSKHLSLSIKKPDIYLCYSPFNSTIHRELDNAPASSIKYVGSPELMKYLQMEEDLIEEPFYLHIDQALAENSFGEETVNKQMMIDFYLKLNQFCINQGAALYIKLHPESFNSSWLPNHENIRYLKNVSNFNKVVQSSIGCFGFYSTMVIPAIYWKPTILFRVQYSGLQEAISAIGAAQVLDFWNFKEAEFSFQAFEDRERIKSYFIQPEGVEDNSLKKYLCE